jgi:hypothetical protein
MGSYIGGAATITALAGTAIGSGVLFKHLEGESEKPSFLSSTGQAVGAIGVIGGGLGAAAFTTAAAFDWVDGHGTRAGNGALGALALGVGAYAAYQGWQKLSDG